MGIQNKLYPPIVEASLPAFEMNDGKETFRIYYDISDYNNIDDIGNIQISIYDNQKNVSVVNNETGIILQEFNKDLYDEEKGLRYIDINYSDLKKYNNDGKSITYGIRENFFFKVQLRFGDKETSSAENIKIKQLSILNKIKNQYDNINSKYNDVAGDGKPLEIIDNYKDRIVEYTLDDNICFYGGKTDIDVYSKNNYIKLYNYENYRFKKIEDITKSTVLLNTIFGVNNWSVDSSSSIPLSVQTWFDTLKTPKVVNFYYLVEDKRTPLDENFKYLVHTYSITFTPGDNNKVIIVISDDTEGTNYVDEFGYKNTTSNSSNIRILLTDLNKIEEASVLTYKSLKAINCFTYSTDIEEESVIRYPNYGQISLSKIEMVIAKNYYDFINQYNVSLSQKVLDENGASLSTAMNTLWQNWNKEYSEKATDNEKAKDYMTTDLSNLTYDNTNGFSVTNSKIDKALAWIGAKINAIDTNEEMPIAATIKAAKIKYSTDNALYKSQLKDLLADGFIRDSEGKITGINPKITEKTSYLMLVRKKNQEIAKLLAQYNNVYAQYYGGIILPTGAPAKKNTKNKLYTDGGNSYLFDYNGNMIISQLKADNHIALNTNADENGNAETTDNYPENVTDQEIKNYPINRKTKIGVDTQLDKIRNVGKGTLITDYIVTETNVAEVDLYCQLGTFDDVPWDVDALITNDSITQKKKEDEYLNYYKRLDRKTGQSDNSTGFYITSLDSSNEVIQNTYYGWYFDSYDSNEDKFIGKNNDSYKDGFTVGDPSSIKTEYKNDDSFMSTLNRYISEEYSKLNNNATAKTLGPIKTVAIAMNKSIGSMIRAYHNLKASQYLTALFMKMKEDEERTDTEKKKDKNNNMKNAYYQNINIRTTRYGAGPDKIDNGSLVDYNVDTIYDSTNQVATPGVIESTDGKTGKLKKYSLLDGQIDYEGISSDNTSPCGFTEQAYLGTVYTKTSTGTITKANNYIINLNNFSKGSMYKNCLSAFAKLESAYVKKTTELEKKIEDAINKKKTDLENSSLGKSYNSILEKITSSKETYNSTIASVRSKYINYYICEITDEDGIKTKYNLIDKYNEYVEAKTKILELFDAQKDKILNSAEGIIFYDDNAVINYNNLITQKYNNQQEQAEYCGSSYIYNLTTVSGKNYKQVTATQSSSYIKGSLETSIDNMNEQWEALKAEYLLALDKFVETLEKTYNISFNFVGIDKNDVGAYYAQIKKELDNLSNTNSSIGGVDWFTNNLDHFSEWSTVLIIKPISKVDIEIKSFSDIAGVSNDIIELYDANPTFIGTFSQNVEDGYQETVKTYNFTITDNKGSIVDTSKNLSITNLNVSNDYTYSSHADYKEDTVYNVNFKIVTDTLFEKSVNYNFTYKNKNDDSLPFEIKCYGDKDAARAIFNLMPMNNAVISSENKDYLIQRADETDGYSNWNDIIALTFKGEEINVYDYTIESDKKYKYRIVSVSDYININMNIPVIEKTINTFHSMPMHTIADSEAAAAETNYIFSVSFDYSYLLGENKQLNIKLNNKMSSFKYVTAETKFEPIDSQFPFITKNGKLFYRTFPVSCIISMRSDEENNLFVSNEELKDFVDDYAKERYFREKVYDFLYNNKYLLYKSATEGNIIIKLMDISFSPADNLGRLIYTLNATAYECYECNPNNISKLGIQTLKDFEELSKKDGTLNKSISVQSVEEDETIDIINLLLNNNTIIKNVKSNVEGFYIPINNSYREIKELKNFIISIEGAANSEKGSEILFCSLLTTDMASEEKRFYKVRTQNNTSNVTIILDNFSLYDKFTISDLDKIFNSYTISISFDYSYDIINTVNNTNIAKTKHYRFAQLSHFFYEGNNIKQAIYNHFSRTVNYGNYLIKIYPDLTDATATTEGFQFLPNPLTVNTYADGSTSVSGMVGFYEIKEYIIPKKE